jgi:hypothetical protein
MRVSCQARSAASGRNSFAQAHWLQRVAPLAVLRENAPHLREEPPLIGRVPKTTRAEVASAPHDFGCLKAGQLKLAHRSQALQVP